MSGRRKKTDTEKNLASERSAPTVLVPAQAPPMPEVFKKSDTLAAVWVEVVREFERLSILAKTDTGCLEIYCILLDQVRRMKKFLIENGETYTTDTKNGTRTFKRPEYEILKDSMLRLKTYATELGATPASRGNVSSLLQADLFDRGKDSANPWAGFGQSH